MFTVFNLLDRAIDTLGHIFDSPHAPETPRSRPQLGLFLIAIVLVPCLMFLGWELSPWSLGVLGLVGVVICAGLLAIWLP